MTAKVKRGLFGAPESWHVVPLFDGTVPPSAMSAPPPKDGKTDSATSSHEIGPTPAPGTRKRAPAKRSKRTVPTREGSLEPSVISERPGDAELAALMPLDVLLRAMREHYAAGRFDEAASFAKDAAPYLHGRQTAASQIGSGASLVRLEWLDPE